MPLPDSLTATVHSGPDESDAVAGLVGALAPRVGRIVFDGYPTGCAGVVGAAPRRAVAVDEHAAHVGRRQRDPAVPAPAGVAGRARAQLPAELRDHDVDLPRRVDGRFVMPR